MVTIELVGFKRLDGLRRDIDRLVREYRVPVVDKGRSRELISASLRGEKVSFDMERDRPRILTFVLTGRMTHDGAYVYELDKSEWDV